MVRVPFRIDRKLPKVPLVRQALSLGYAPVCVLHGIVLGPGSHPLMHAQVEIPALHLITYTDAAGAFKFVGVPADQGLQLSVQAKGKNMAIMLTPVASGGEPIQIRLDEMEV